MEEIRNYTQDQFANFSATLMGDMNIIENLVLKSHVISEFAINCYLESISNTQNLNLFKGNYTYSHKLFLLEQFGKLPTENAENVILAFKLLNKLRNEFAHKLTFNENVLRDLMLAIKRINPEFLNEKSTDNKEDYLVYVENVSFLLSVLNGYLFGVFTINRDGTNQR